MVAAEIGEREVTPANWDKVWSQIPIPIRFMLPYFVWANCIYVTNVVDLHFRVGGFTSSQVTHILLSRSERMKLRRGAYEHLSQLMDAEVTGGGLPREKYAHNSLNVQEEVAKLVPHIIEVGPLGDHC